ncbi:hypothetical protein [Paraliobacillus sp. JSM ZJ581]|uniref:hypothetical protein n=1 Tax=Paraliobacillus sp. JSM ZJ581 TaxID=3342118 RepID=UPI0035A87971
MDRIKKATARFVCVILFIPILLTPENHPFASDKEQLVISFLNIPDGEATLIQTSEGDNILINTGSTYSLDNLINQLNQLHVKKINSIILTNQTDAYQGNLNHLLNNYNVETVITAVKTEHLIDLIDKQIVKEWKKSNDYSLSKHLNCYVHDTTEQGEMTISIMYGKNSILYMGFSENPTLQSIIEQTDRKPDIIKIPNFAQGDSPSEQLLKDIDPHISIIFHIKSGKLNRSLIERLNESWIDVYQLKRVGTTIIQMNLQDYQIIS